MRAKGRVQPLVARTERDLGIRFLELNENEMTRIYVKCTHCNEEFLRERKLLNQRHHCLPQPRTFCKSAVDWIKVTLQALKEDCATKSIDYNLDFEYVKNLCEKQKGRCYYNRTDVMSNTGALYNATFNRLTNELGYVRGNVVLASKRYDCLVTEEADRFLHYLMVGLTAPIRLECKRIHPDAKLPFRKRITDACYDVATVEAATIPPHGVVNFPTGLIISAPPGFYYTVDGRSSLWSAGIVPFRGTIDATYVGDLHVAVMNISDIPYEVAKGDRIAQLTLHRILMIDLVEVDEFSPEYNKRGTNGFGSSGK